MSKFLDKIEAKLTGSSTNPFDLVYVTASAREINDAQYLRTMHEYRLGLNISQTVLVHNNNQDEIEYHLRMLKASVAKEVYGDIIDELFVLYQKLGQNYIEPEVREQIDEILMMVNP